MVGVRNIIIPQVRCRYLTTDSHGGTFCRIYAQRFEQTSWCLTLNQAIDAGALAHDCPYISLLDKQSGYQGKFRLSQAILKRIQPQLEAHLLRHGIPGHCDPELAATFFTNTMSWELREDRWWFSEEELSRARDHNDRRSW